MHKNLLAEIGLKATEDSNLFADSIGRRFLLIEKPEFYEVEVLNEDDEIAHTLRFCRVRSDEETLEWMKKNLITCIEEGESFFKHFDYYKMTAAWLRGAIGHELSDEQIQMVCNLYNDAVRADEIGKPLCYMCKEIIHIRNMTPSCFVRADVHEMLLQVSDVYYQFLLGIERNLNYKPEIEQRLIQFLKRHAGEEMNTVRVIIYVSCLNASLEISDERLEEILQIYEENHCFDALYVPDAANEFTANQNDYGWKKTSFFTSGMGFTIRQAGPICFLDYTNAAVVCGILRRLDEKTAEIVPIFNSAQMVPGSVSAKLIQYMERIVMAAMMTDVLVWVKEEKCALYEGIGYELTDQKEEDGQVLYLLHKSVKPASSIRRAF